MYFQQRPMKKETMFLKTKLSTEAKACFIIFLGGEIVLNFHF